MVGDTWQVYLYLLPDPQIVKLSFDGLNKKYQSILQTFSLDIDIIQLQYLVLRIIYWIEWSAKTNVNCNVWIFDVEGGIRASRINQSSLSFSWCPHHQLPGKGMHITLLHIFGNNWNNWTVCRYDPNTWSYLIFTWRERPSKYEIWMLDFHYYS